MSATLTVFFAIAGAAAYLIGGYPLLLLLRRKRPVRKNFAPRTVSVILAVRNGEKWLEAKLENLSGLDYPPGLMEILVVSDGSTDSTAAIARRWAERGVILLERPAEGKSAALNAALKRARGEILLFTDVRQPLAENSLRELVACFDDPLVGVVSGELILADGDSREEAAVGLYWKYEKWIRKRLSAIDSFFGATGCIYAMRRDLAPQIPKGILNDDMFLPLGAFFKGFRLILDPAARAFDSPASLDVEFRRKVRTQAGVYQLLRYYPQLLGPGNRQWIDFVSHKLGRLLLPWLLAALLGVSFFLPGRWRAAAAAQLFVYTLAIIDRFLPGGSAVKRLSSPLRAFVTLMAAAVCAVGILIIPAERFWPPSPAPKQVTEATKR